MAKKKKNHYAFEPENNFNTNMKNIIGLLALVGDKFMTQDEFDERRKKFGDDDYGHYRDQYFIRNDNQYISYLIEIVKCYEYDFHRLYICVNNAINAAKNEHKNPLANKNLLKALKDIRDALRPIDCSIYTNVVSNVFSSMKDNTDDAEIISFLHNIIEKLEGAAENIRDIITENWDVDTSYVAFNVAMSSIEKIAQGDTANEETE